MNTIVISNVHRPALITPHIKDFNPVVSLTPDYPYPQIGHFRCFHGHTNALIAHMTDPVALVFEDDCVPSGASPWKEVIAAGEKILLEQDLDFVCLHGRGFDFSKFDRVHHHGFIWLKPKTQDRWVLGTLAYLVSKKGAKKFCSTHFWCGGFNIDLFVWGGQHDWLMIDSHQFYERGRPDIMSDNQRPFIHDRSQGSILENGKNVEFVIR